MTSARFWVLKSVCCRGNRKVDPQLFGQWLCQQTDSSCLEALGVLLQPNGLQRELLMVRRLLCCSQCISVGLLVSVNHIMLSS